MITIWRKIKNNSNQFSRPMRKVITTLLLALSMGAFAQDFNHYFEDATLRLDYIFAGNAKEQTIAVDELSRIPHWYGRVIARNRLRMSFSYLIQRTRQM